MRRIALLLGLLASAAQAQEHALDASVAELKAELEAERLSLHEPAPEKEPEKKTDIPAQAKELDGVALQGLNKVTGHLSRLEGHNGKTVHFGNLDIIPRRCWVSSPEEQPENAALLEIWEMKPGEGPQRVFMGWMFSSSPGLSGLEHPVYDISVISCLSGGAEEKSPAAEKPAGEGKKPTSPAGANRIGDAAKTVPHQ